jgi:hypothetical protein
LADINQIITLGIGTPADIEHFILMGLNATGPVAVIDATPDWIVQCAADDMHVVVPPDTDVVP